MGVYQNKVITLHPVHVLEKETVHSWKTLIKKIK